jgi:hypothetical protein
MITSSTYFSEVLIEENLVLSLLPSPLTTAMMAREIPAAIRPYSMASRRTRQPRMLEAFS